jgi:hypothetical protein
MISLLGDIFWTRKRPAKAAAILCIKTKANAGAKL